MLVQADDNRRVLRDKRGDEQAQEDATERAAGPGGTVEHTMIILELRLVVQAQDAQSAGDGADAWCEDGANDEDFGIVPDPFRKDRLKLSQHMYNREWQVSHVAPFLDRRR
jgi:hypothetical protein